MLQYILLPALPDSNTGKKSSPFSKPKITIPNNILKNTLNISDFPAAVMQTPRNVVTPTNIKK